GVSAGKNSLFLALRPDADAAAQIAACQEALRDARALRGKPIGADRVHMTLHHIGEFDEIPGSVVDQVGNAAASVRAEPFEVVLDRAKSFPRKTGNSPLVLTASAVVEPLRQFHKDLGTALEMAGLRTERRSFTPHLTLLWDPQRLKEEPVPPVRWLARD